MQSGDERRIDGEYANILLTSLAVRALIYLDLNIDAFRSLGESLQNSGSNLSGS